MLLTLLAPDPIRPGTGLQSGYRVRGSVGATEWVYKFTETVTPEAGLCAVYFQRGSQLITTWVPNGTTIAPVQLNYDYRSNGTLHVSAWTNNFVSIVASPGTATLTGVGAVGTSGILTGAVLSSTAITHSYRQQGTTSASSWNADGIFTGGVPGIAYLTGSGSTGSVGTIIASSVVLSTAPISFEYRNRGSTGAVSWLSDGIFVPVPINFDYRSHGSGHFNTWNYVVASPAGAAAITGAGSTGLAGTIVGAGAGTAFITGSGAVGSPGIMVGDASFNGVAYITGVGAVGSSGILGQAASTGTDLIWKILADRQTLDPVTGKFTIYDTDGTTILFRVNAWEDPAGTIPYRGKALGRIDALV